MDSYGEKQIEMGMAAFKCSVRNSLIVAVCLSCFQKMSGNKKVRLSDASQASEKVTRPQKQKTQCNSMNTLPHYR